MALTSGQVIRNRYRVVALLSPGGMSAVYEAIDLSLDVRCAVKEMVPYPGTPETSMPQLREQFRQEAQLLAELRYPNLPRVTDHFEESGNVYLVMDFVYGKRLDQIIAQEGMLAEDEVLGWARQLIGALAYCHEQGVIHRDVKPQNVLITPQGQAMLVDFGLAKLIDPGEPRTRTVMRGLGTPEYAPPEQYDAKKGYTDARTDIYSLGATLYHALTGEAPPTVTEQVVNPESLMPPSQYRDDLSEVTEQVLMRAMALQPSQRFQNVAEMYESLFGSPPSKVKAESTALWEGGTDMLVRPPSTTILLPWIGAAKRRIDWRVGVAAAIAIMSLMVFLVTREISAGNTPTATATPTVTATMTPTVTITMTPTHTPTVTPSSTATPTASPTSRPPTRQPTEPPFDMPSARTPASPTPTRVIPSPTYTPSPTPTNTRRPAPVRTRTPSPIPTDTPTLIPTYTPAPTLTPTIPRPTPGPTPTPEPLSMESSDGLGE